MRQIIDPKVSDRLSRGDWPIATGNSGQVREIIQGDFLTLIDKLSMWFLSVDSR